MTHFNDKKVSECPRKQHCWEKGTGHRCVLCCWCSEKFTTPSLPPRADLREHSEACADSPLKECNQDCPARDLRGELLDGIFNLLFGAESLTEQDLKRGKLALQYPEVHDLYTSDMADRFKRYEKGKDLIRDAFDRYGAAKYEEGRSNQAPMGASQWREHGKKFGYWDYFEKEVENGNYDEGFADAWKESRAATLAEAKDVLKKEFDETISENWKSWEVSNRIIILLEALLVKIEKMKQ